MRIFIFIILTVAFFSCNTKDSKPAGITPPTTRIPASKKENPLIQIEQLLTNEGLVNIPLNIVEQNQKDGYMVYRIQAMSKRDTLELVVRLKEEIPAGFVDGSPTNSFLVDGIIFESTGPKSDRLLTTLAQKYQINTGRLTMKPKQVFTCANLTHADVNYQSGTPKFKIFLEGGTEVAELYVNFDFDKSIIFLNEKDPQYRKALISLLKKQEQ